MTKPRPVGRPPRAKGTGTRFEIRLTEPEVIRWQRAATRQGLTLAELVRECVETHIDRRSTR